jgi:hypothetical protein
MQLKIYVLAAMLSVSAIASAQNKDSVEPERIKDILKINITSLVLKNVSVQYEYILSKKISLAFGARFMHSTAIPFEDFLIDAVGNEDEDVKSLIETSRIGNVAITPEVRFYMGKGYGKGFYIAPYYRFAHFSTNTLIVNYSEPGGPKRSITMNGGTTAHTGGVMFGAQWLLGKNFTFDWWILGAHYGAGNGEFSGVPAPPLTPGEQADIRSTLEDIDVPLINKEITITPNSVLVKTSGPFGALRAGLVFGVRF